MKVLFVDDEERRLIPQIKMLKLKYGIEYEILNNCDLVLEELDKGFYSAIVLDVMMPVPKILKQYEDRLENGINSGLVFIEKILAPYFEKRKLEIPVIVLSNRNDVQALLDKYEFVKDVQVKPFDYEQMNNELKRFK